MVKLVRYRHSLMNV